MEDLTLDTLLRFLQVHFKEGNASDLCSQLISMTQLPDQTTCHFVIHCLEMHQKVIVACKQSDHITYDSNLVQQLFLRTLERGISSKYVLSEIYPYLKTGSVNDEALILAVTKAAAAERDRKIIFHPSLRKLRVLWSV